MNTGEPVSLEVGIVKREKGVVVVTPAGEITTETYQVLESKVVPLLSPETKMIILDFKAVRYISSMGLSVLFRVKETMKKNGGSFTLVDLQPQVKDVFDSVKFIPDYMFASLEEADQNLDSFLDALQKGEIKDRKNKI